MFVWASQNNYIYEHKLIYLNEKSTNANPMLNGRRNFLYPLNIMTDPTAIHQLDDQDWPRVMKRILRI